MSDETEVVKLYERVLAAWNRRDAAGFAEMFAADGLLVGFDGSQVRGQDVAGHLGPIFEDHPTAAYVGKVVGGRAVGTSGWLLHAIAGMVPPGGARVDPALNAVQTVVAEKRGAGWRVVLFQNTPAQYRGRPEAAAEHTAALGEPG
ncbi:SgcJ/EcaC family oxidoreductase [Actinoplanes sp. URMC 104]|uniref:SgcJ/EcaC family oxidoreductase n=1 Tax=Actinoplanes sp. URMC 104 TaxID=3423409 RepID=UPI003F19982C